MVTIGTFFFPQQGFDSEEIVYAFELAVHHSRHPLSHTIAVDYFCSIYQLFVMSGGIIIAFS